MRLSLSLYSKERAKAIQYKGPPELSLGLLGLPVYLELAKGEKSYGRKVDPDRVGRS